MMDADRATKILLRAILPSLLGAHRVRASFTPDELDAAIDWLNSDAVKVPATVAPRVDVAIQDVDVEVVRKAATTARRKARK